ncbi:nucleoside 2-deoxyribosyltransferase domain-containing protein [bacterium]|nr:nucleoside 2-deoxyribosyltransferase domain-containing protein [bacterium]
MGLLLFLGGTKNNSSWREDLVPLLDYEKLAYFNPVVKTWDDEAYEREMFLKSLPTTVELFVITEESKNKSDITEALNSSLQKPERTIFMYLPEGFSQEQVNSLEIIKDTIKENGGYTANSLYEVGYVFKGLCLGNNSDKINNRLANRRKKLNLEKIFNSLESTLKYGKKGISYEDIFDILGITDLLESTYIDISELSKSYRDIIFKSLKNFIKLPLYKDLKLENEDDLRFLRDSAQFKGFIKNIFEEIKNKLVSRQYRVEKYLKKFDTGIEVEVDEVAKDTNLDKVSLMFILSELKENKKIYDYNGRVVNLL